MNISDALGIAGKHVVITGGGGALGGAVVEQFRSAGAICHVPLRRKSAAAVTQQPMDTTSTAGVNSVFGVDLTDEASVVAFYDRLPAPLWASVHLAGGFAMSPIADTSAAAFREQLEQNLVTAFLCCREAAKAIRSAAEVPTSLDVHSQADRRGGGRIVQVASRSGLRPEPNQVAYSVSKAAVAALTAGLAAELKTENIFVNAVAPGTIDTPANRAAMPKADPRTWVSPIDLASLIVWLASPSNVAVSGATLAL